MSLATYQMTALGNVATKSRSFFVAARVSSVAFAWLEPISVRAGRAIDCASVVEYATYDALHAEDAGGVEAGVVVIRDGGLGISRAERAGGVPVGGEFRFVREGVMETVEDGFNVLLMSYIRTDTQIPK